MTEFGAAKILLGYAMGAMLASPLVGWSLAKLEVPVLPAMYIMLLLFAWPLFWLGVSALRRWER